MGTENERANSPSGVGLVCARDSSGRFATTGEQPAASTKPRREQRQRALKERDYLRAIVAKVGRDDLVAVAAAIVRDAKGQDDADVKVVNAAREWVGKYLLGNARVALDDCDDLPAIVKRK